MKSFALGLSLLAMLSMLPSCTAIGSYEKTVAARQVSVSGAGTGKDFKAAVAYRVEYKP